MAARPKKSSIVWDHFNDIGNSQASCNICKTQLSFKSSVSNLKKHLSRKHPTVQLLNMLSDESEMHPTTNVRSHVSNSNLLENFPAAGQTRALCAPRRTYDTPPISSFMCKRNTQDANIINEKVFNLFIYDFQPFRLVEMRGFREFVTYAFPHYTIPTRKYFANTMLPAQYEKIKLDIKEKVEKDLQSACITIDIWTSTNNDSYMAITCHYIEVASCTMQNILLDCVPLETSHTAANLAYEIRKICGEWKILGKVLLGVTDNGRNIKNAIEKELGWKHFPCYSHTLNLIVQDALKNPDVQQILEKIKGIVRHFKKSNVAWEKLKKCQEQQGILMPKRPIQEVVTRWNSTFYMIRRCLELREALNSAMVNLGMTVLSPHEWQICQELSVILEPCEEVTREISGEKYITGSLVIPITMGLKTALERIRNEVTLLPVVERVRQDIIGGLKSRFPNLERSKTLSNSMFLDPRFKLYFEDSATAEETKRQIICLISSEGPVITVTNTASTAAVETSIAGMSMARTLTAGTTTADKSTVKSIWQDYHEKMARHRPEGTPMSRAVLEVQRYLDEPILNRQECPLQWWKEHQAAYPSLFSLATKKLNTMASSVPCERIFSAAGNILRERRTRLGCRKLQQILFLQQNKKL